MKKLALMGLATTAAASSLLLPALQLEAKAQSAKSTADSFLEFSKEALYFGGEDAVQITGGEDGDLTLTGGGLFLDSNTSVVQAESEALATSEGTISTYAFSFFDETEVGVSFDSVADDRFLRATAETSGSETSAFGNSGFVGFSLPSTLIQSEGDFNSFLAGFETALDGEDILSSAFRLVDFAGDYVLNNLAGSTSLGSTTTVAQSSNGGGDTEDLFESSDTISAEDGEQVLVFNFARTFASAEIEAEAVPEPMTLLGLGAVGLVGAGSALKRKQAAKA